MTNESNVTNETESMNESDELREMRESIEEMEEELAELDRDIAEARKGEKGELSKIALDHFQLMRDGIVDMIDSSRELHKLLVEGDSLIAELESEVAG